MAHSSSNADVNRIYDPLTFRGKAAFVAIDGACRNNGHPTAKAAYGIFHDVGSSLNEARETYDLNPISQRVELYAAIILLQKVSCDPSEICEGPGISQLVVKTDSAYLVNSMTKYINKWRSNGYMTSRNEPVVNKELFDKIDDLMEELFAEEIVQVRFWLVPRNQNTLADGLAKMALAKTALA